MRGIIPPLASWTLAGSDVTVLSIPLCPILLNNFMKHFKTTSQACKCDPLCHIKDLQQLSLSFSAIDEENRIDEVRFMLLKITFYPTH